MCVRAQKQTRPCALDGARPTPLTTSPLPEYSLRSVRALVQFCALHTLLSTSIFLVGGDLSRTLPRFGFQATWEVA